MAGISETVPPARRRVRRRRGPLLYRDVCRAGVWVGRHVGKHLRLLPGQVPRHLRIHVAKHGRQRRLGRLLCCLQRLDHFPAWQRQQPGTAWGAGSIAQGSLARGAQRGMRGVRAAAPTARSGSRAGAGVCGASSPAPARSGAPPPHLRASCRAAVSWASSHHPWSISQRWKRVTGSRARHCRISSAARYLPRMWAAHVGRACGDMGQARKGEERSLGRQTFVRRGAAGAQRHPPTPGWLSAARLA